MSEPSDQAMCREEWEVTIHFQLPKCALWKAWTRVAPMLKELPEEAVLFSVSVSEPKQTPGR